MKDFISNEAREELTKANQDAALIESEREYINTLPGMARYSIHRAMIDPTCEVSPSDIIAEFRQMGIGEVAVSDFKIFSSLCPAPDSDCFTCFANGSTLTSFFCQMPGDTIE